MRQAILFQDEDGRWVAEVPSLPGCVSQGDTRDDALHNLQEAAELWIETMREQGQPIPGDSGTLEIAPIRVAEAG